MLRPTRPSGLGKGTVGSPSGQGPLTKQLQEASPFSIWGVLASDCTPYSYWHPTLPQHSSQEHKAR